MKPTTEEELQKLWDPVQSVMDYLRMEYDERVTLGSQFGQLSQLIREKDLKIQELEYKLERQVKTGFTLEGRLQEARKKIEELKAHITDLNNKNIQDLIQQNEKIEDNRP